MDKKFRQPSYQGAGGIPYSATFSAISVAAAQDIFEIVSPSNKRVAIKEIRMGQYSDAGDAAAELLSVLVVKGYTTSGSGGAAVTPAPLDPVYGAAASTVERNNTTVAQDGTATVLIADAWNVQGGWLYLPAPEDRIILPASTRLVVRITLPADAITMNGTLIFEEMD